MTLGIVFFSILYVLLFLFFWELFYRILNHAGYNEEMSDCFLLGLFFPITIFAYICYQIGYFFVWLGDFVADGIIEWRNRKEKE